MSWNSLFFINSLYSLCCILYSVVLHQKTKKKPQGDNHKRLFLCHSSDSSALNRIFDDQAQARIYLESSSMLLVFMLIENGFVDIVSSDALIFEKSQNPHDERRMFVSVVLEKAKIFNKSDEKILERAEEIEQQYRIKGMDALHLACAEQLQVDAFITCDDKIIKKYQGILSVINPVTFTMDFLLKEQNQ